MQTRTASALRPTTGLEWRALESLDGIAKERRGLCQGCPDSGTIALRVGDRRQETEDRRQKTEDRRQKTEDRRQKTEDRRQFLLDS
jgi:hypothetical protein